MVSTRQMSITVGPEAGSSGVNANNGSNRTPSNSVQSTSRQQLNNQPVSNTNDATQSAGAVAAVAAVQQIQRTDMPRRESVRRSHPLSYECDIIETCCMRLSLLQLTFGRYIEHKHICFFPGAFLDEVYNVLNCIRTTPNLGRPFKITEELIDLSTMAMEYFKDHLEPSMPQFGLPNRAFFGKSSTTTRTSSKDCYPFNGASTSAASSVSASTRSSQSSSMPSPPQSNMVLRKGIRKIKQGMKKYNNQLSLLRNDLRFCKRKSTDQTKQITELQNMLAEQQKQTLEYANRLDENDKKSDEMSSKISTLLQELNKCKIELHYYRSKSPAAPICNNCGQTTLTIPPGNLLALMKQNINDRSEEIINVIDKYNNIELESKVQSHESNISEDLRTTPKSNASNAALLLHTDDNKKAPNALDELNISMILPPESDTTTSTSSSSSVKPSNRDGVMEHLEKRWNLARNKETHSQSADWRYAASVVDATLNEPASNSAKRDAITQSPPPPLNDQQTKKAISNSSVILT